MDACPALIGLKPFNKTILNRQVKSGKDTYMEIKLNGTAILRLCKKEEGKYVPILKGNELLFKNFGKIFEIISIKGCTL